MTDAERLLWSKLRRHRIEGVRFRRQVPIGAYIADFASYDPKIVIELDGGQHLDQADADRSRDAFFAENGFAVLRFWNHEIFQQLEAVEEVIARSCRGTPPP